MSTWTVQDAADELLACEDDRRDREPFSDEWAELDLDTAYDIQDATRDRRVARGEHIVGVKLGLTSRAKQHTMNVDQPLVAWLTDTMVLPTGASVPPSLIHPRVEPELAFVLGRELGGPGVTTAQALAAVETVHAAAEVIDSRYRNFRFTLPDVVADNASSGHSSPARSRDVWSISTWRWKPSSSRLTDAWATPPPGPPSWETLARPLLRPPTCWALAESP